MALLLFWGHGMELGELKVFLAVASERSFSRAALKLYRTQPAVSQAIRRLEEQLGERLFDRQTKHATLTDAGSVLFREGTRLIHLAEEAKAAVKRQSARGRTILRIAGSEVGAHVVLPAISTFMREHGGMSVEFHSVAAAHLAAEVTAGTFDVGVGAPERVPAQLDHIRVAVQDCGFSLVIPRGHPLCGRKSAAMSVLHHERLVVVADAEWSERLAVVFAQAPVEPTLVTGMPGIDSLKRAVEMGLGIGVVPGSVASALHSESTLAAVPLASATHLNALTIVYRRNESQSGSTAQFIDVVRRSQPSSVTSEGVSRVLRAAARR
jgi:DNA-binding transcriptional LysR family regulator